MPKARTKTAFVCQQCGYSAAKWAGRCPCCGEWNSLVETIESAAREKHESPFQPSFSEGRPVPLSEVSATSFPRLPVPMEEFNHTLGGGIVPGSIVLIGGDPGIGKSTLLLQVSLQLAEQQGPVLYVSGEESVHQIKMRADRLGSATDKLFLLAETNLAQILVHIEQMRPRVVIVDSIQSVYLEELESSAGSISQVRECAAALLRLGKARQIPIFIVGHVTKTGVIAGPRVLEHMVDTVLYLEGERFHSYRLLRSVKNRFGSTNEVGVFEMGDSGLIEIKNPSQAFLSERLVDAPGSVIAVTLEGTRPLLVEIQALTSATSSSLPRRTTNGVDLNRLLLLVAVLSKRVGLSLGNQDVFVNVVGGLKISEPAVDLSVAVAVASSFRNRPVSSDLVVVGEIGLSGELRSVSQMDRRLREATKLGFKRCLMPRASVHKRDIPEGIEVIGVRSLAEALDVALGAAA
jgi:DNA repair protein RadA/Sms